MSHLNRQGGHPGTAQAAGILGSKAIAAATEATAPTFGDEIGHYIHAHPWEATGQAIGLMVPAFELGELTEGAITGVEALHDAYELGKETHTRGNQ